MTIADVITNLLKTEEKEKGAYTNNNSESTKKCISSSQLIIPEYLILQDLLEQLLKVHEPLHNPWLATLKAHHGMFERDEIPGIQGSKLKEIIGNLIVDLKPQNA